MADDILIVDDEADIRELVSGILQDEGFITRSATTRWRTSQAADPTSSFSTSGCRAAGSTGCNCSMR
jgi:DNA-binding NtrC family response regulator